MYTKFLMEKAAFDYNLSSECFICLIFSPYMCTTLSMYTKFLMEKAAFYELNLPIIFSFDCFLSLFFSNMFEDFFVIFTVEILPFITND